MVLYARGTGLDIPLSKPKIKAPRHEKIAQTMLIHATVNRGFDSSIVEYSNEAW